MQKSKSKPKDVGAVKAESMESMDNITDGCQEWTSCTANLIQTNEEYRIRILLQDGSLSQAYIEITNKSGRYGLFPCNRLLEVRFNFSIICFTFTHITKIANREPTLIFIITDSLQLELLVSQIRLCATVCSIAVDEFKELNTNFLQGIASDKSLVKEMHVMDVFETNCALCPVTFSKTARKTWEARSHFLNASYFTSTTPLRVACLTWNVGGGKPTSDVSTVFNSAMEYDPEILFFAFQEIDMRLKSVVTGNSSVASEWEKMISESIEGASGKYVIATSRSLGGVYACVAYKKGITLPVEITQQKLKRLGAGGMTANKGGVITTAKIGGHATFTFIGCHLAAHAERVDERTKELVGLVRKASTGNGVDYVILMGDLNYRLDLTYEDAIDFMNKKDFYSLLSADQLTKIRMEDEILQDMREAPISFFPTYKFDKGKDVYDTGPKHRTPSYTDRVLFKTFPPRLAVGAAKTFLFETDLVHHLMPQAEGFLTESCFTIEPHEHTFPRPPAIEAYDKIQSTFSDHRPVLCRMVFNVPIEVPEKVAEFEQFKLKKLDEMENLSHPHVSIPAKVTVAVGDKVMIPMMNTSIAWARWTTHLIGDGVSVEPNTGVLIPGVTVEIAITVEKMSKDPVLVLFEDKGTLGVLEVTTVKKKKRGKSHKHV